MSDLILHHYWESPYAEKIRRILGFKGLEWSSVIIPMVMPKPDLTALTGGYRKTPVLQIGADIYCDSDLIARVLDALRPEPPLFPDDSEGLAYMIGPWQQELFWLAVRAIGTSAPIFPDGFIEDRAQMMEGGLSLEKVLANLPAERDQLRAKLDLLERRLAARGPFVLGAKPTLADFSLFHPLYGVKMIPQTTALLEPYAAVRSWLERIEAYGHGKFSEMEGARAVEIANKATPAAKEQSDPGDPNGRKPGERVTVVHEGFGNDPVVGVLVAASVHEIAVRRRDERAGEVAVHFPREHYHVSPA